MILIVPFLPYEACFFVKSLHVFFQTNRKKMQQLFSVTFRYFFSSAVSRTQKWERKKWRKLTSFLADCGITFFFVKSRIEVKTGKPVYGFFKHGFLIFCFGFFFLFCIVCFKAKQNLKLEDLDRKQVFHEILAKDSRTEIAEISHLYLLALFICFFFFENL